LIQPPQFGELSETELEEKNRELREKIDQIKER
jgi:hypothetical protein